MKTIEIQRRPVDVKELQKKTALVSDTDVEYSEPAIFTLDGQPVIFYGQCEFDGSELVRKACQSIKYHGGERSSGLHTSSRIFGAMPRDPLRRDYTGLGTMAYDHPDETQAFYSLGEHFDSLYRKLAPEVYAEHLDKVSKVLPEWRMKDTVFTGGIVNNSNSLQYHFDRGNFKGALSCMLTLKRGISGGCLSFPEFNFRLNLQDNTYLLFDGQAILHGVTTIEEINERAYRYTVVYYSLEALLKSQGSDEELRNANRRAREKYSRRAGLT